MSYKLSFGFENFNQFLSFINYSLVETIVETVVMVSIVKTPRQNERSILSRCFGVLIV